MKKILFLFICINLNAQTTIPKNIDSLLLNGNYKAVLTILDKQNPSFDAFNKKGLIYQQIGNYSKAIKSYENALSFNESPKTKENLGKCYQKSNKPDKAILLFEEVLNKNDNNLLLKFHLAKLYKSKSQFNKAKILFQKLIKSDNENPNYFYYLGSTYRNLKKNDSAKIAFLKAVKVDSTHFKSLYNLAKLFRKKNKYAKLKSPLIPKVNQDTSYYYLEKGLFLYPESNALKRLAAKYYYADKNYQKTIDLLTSINLLKTEEKQTLATCYYYTKDDEKSMDYLYDLIENRKASGKTFYYLSLIYKAKKNYELAEKYMEFAIHVEQPQLTEYYYQLAMIYQEDKQLQKAIDNFKKALAENYYNSEAQYQLALTSDSF